MNKGQLCEILESCLLFYEGLTENELINQGLSVENVQIGIKLAKFLEVRI